MVVGGRTAFTSNISEEAMDVFDQAFENYAGVQYQPVAVATQVVAGINYIFFCNAKIVGPHEFNKAAMVIIYQPLDAPARITDIREV